jgi:hypothetical protein
MEWVSNEFQFAGFVQFLSVNFRSVSKRSKDKGLGANRAKWTMIVDTGQGPLRQGVGLQATRFEMAHQSTLSGAPR